MRYNWFHYFEAGSTGTNLSDVTITGANTAKATVTATAVCREPWLPGFVKCTGNGTAHIILAVTDDGSPQLTSYRRVIVNVRPATAVGAKARHNLQWRLDSITMIPSVY